MNNIININSPVTITSIGFDRSMHAYPKRMEWQGQTYYFVDRGIHVRRGQTHAGSMTMSDGRQNFCLKKNGLDWMLISVSMCR